MSIPMEEHFNPRVPPAVPMKPGVHESAVASPSTNWPLVLSVLLTLAGVGGLLVTIYGLAGPLWALGAGSAVVLFAGYVLATRSS